MDASTNGVPTRHEERSGTANAPSPPGSAGGSRFWAIVRQRCPQCRQGRVFGGAVEMNEKCPVCGLTFEREQGYFLGAMYISYTLSIILLGLVTLGLSLLLPTWDLGLLVLLGCVVYLPVVPLVFRYSRVLWIHFDRWAWPGRG